MTGTATTKPRLSGGAQGHEKKPVSVRLQSPALRTGNVTRSGATRWGIAGIALTLLLSPALLPQAFSAREDSARLLLEKTAGHRKTRLYVVKKGDFLTGIFRSQMGDEAVPYPLIRQLNPTIKDLNKIYPGQRLLLPIRETIDLSESSNAVRQENALPERTYRIRENDSISRIILAELHAGPEDALTAYRLLRQLNPETEDLNSLPPGSVLRLPPDFARPENTMAPPVEAAALPMEKPQADLAAAIMKSSPTADALLGMVRPVISRMKGTITAAGNYYIPLKDAAQVTIDCSLIPIIEMDDGSTVLLDFGNRLSENLKGLITQSWPNTAFVSAEELRDDLTSLQGIIRRSRNYTIVHADRPLTVTSKPEILAFPDWVISGKKAVGGTLYRQGLFLLGENEHPFPTEALLFLEKNGLIVTEITAGNAVTPPAPPSTPAAPDLRELKGIAFAEELLKTLGETPVKNTGIVIFDQAKDGFNLSITADLLILKGRKRFLIQKKRLPDEFIRILKDEGTEVLTVRENGSGRALIEELLGRLGIPISFGHFSVRIPEEGSSPRLTATFPALRAVAGGETLYLIDFDISSEVLSLLRGRLAGRIAKY